MNVRPQVQTPFDALIDDMRDQKFTAGWAKRKPSLWSEPRTDYVPKIWRYRDARAGLDRAGELVSTELAERRILLMFDDADPNQYATTRTIVSAYQLLKPGEYARSHRHSPNAMRLILDAPDDVFTVVDGAQLPMREGSFLLTPGKCWHSHFSKGDRSAYWIDVLDVPLVQQLEPMFFEPHPDGFEPVREVIDAHPWVMTREFLTARLAEAPSVDGVRVADLSSEDIPTLSLLFTGLDPGASMTVKEAANNVFAVYDGSGAVKAGDLDTTFERGDLIALPIWNEAVFSTQAGATFLRVSDAAAMKKLGLYKPF